MPNKRVDVEAARQRAEQARIARERGMQRAAVQQDQKPTRQKKKSEPPPRAHRHRTERRKKRSKYFFVAFLALFTVAVVLVLSLKVFFFITEFSVEGNKHYSEEQILQYMTVQKGENLFLADINQAANHIMDNLPYLDRVTVRRSLPDRLRVIVEESSPVCQYSYNGQWYLVDAKSKALECIGTDAREGLLVLTDTAAPVAQPGYLLYETASRSYSNFNALMAALQTWEDASLVGELRVAGDYDLTLVLDGRVEAELGGTDRLSDKLLTLGTIFDGLTAHQSGRLDLSDPDRVPFVANS